MQITSLTLPFFSLPPDGRCFHPLRDAQSLEACSRLLYQLAHCLLLRLDLTNSPNRYSFPLTESDETRASALIESLKMNLPGQEGFLHNFLFSFFLPSDYSAENAGPTKWNQVLEHFYGIYFLNQDGTFQPPTLAIPVFERMLYLIRGATLYDAFLRTTHYSGDLYLLVPVIYRSFLP